jgi:alkanesulfonate monooxygenase SsuD/methylene tetrahydromethanopterin reductase-like flavin-dependent oxidoreductase (luciferase family)
MKTPSFGLLVPQRLAVTGQARIADLQAYGAKAEAAGMFDAVWVGDSLTAQARPDAIAMLGALAATTKRIRLGTACMASFPIRDPVVFAYQWATLDQISGGRMTLGVCTGIVPGGQSAREGAHWGVDDAERPARLEENLRLCRDLWSGQKINFAGTFHRYADLQIEPVPAQDPCPVIIGANPWNPRYVDRAMRRVACLGDGWLTANSWPGLLSALRDRLAAHLTDIGRDIHGFPIYALHNVVIGDDREECLDQAHTFIDAHEDSRSPREMIRAWTAAGTPHQCAEDLRGILELGVDHLILRLAGTDQQLQWQLLTEEVMPLLAGAA